MERIKLTKSEKKTLRSLLLGFKYPPDGVSRAAWLSAIRILHGIGFVKAAFVDGGDVESVRMTDRGRSYMEQNPRLLNPVDWAKVSAIAAIVTAVLASIALVMACGKYL